MQILIFCPAGKSFSVNETCEFLNYSFFKKLFSAILIHDPKFSSEGSGAFEEGEGSEAGLGVGSGVGLDGGSHSPGATVCSSRLASLITPLPFSRAVGSAVSVGLFPRE